MLSLSNRCVTANGIIFHSASSSPQWPCMLTVWPSTLLSSMTTAPSLTLPPARECSSAPAGVRSFTLSVHPQLKYSILFQLNDAVWQKWMGAQSEESCFCLSFYINATSSLLQTVCFHPSLKCHTSLKIAGWHFWQKQQQLMNPHKTCSDDQPRHCASLPPSTHLQFGWCILSLRANNITDLSIIQGSWTTRGPDSYQPLIPEPLVKQENSGCQLAVKHTHTHWRSSTPHLKSLCCLLGNSCC